ncbi:MAG: hypothetical protein ACI8TX_000798 [Hyphomicrobiaceae bacterium]|jgi:hypothetical protein
MKSDSSNTESQRRDNHGSAESSSGVRAVGLGRFLAKVAALLALVLAGHLVVAVWPVPPVGYLSAVADKQQHLVSLESPKLVFVGGSNLSFGIDSSLLEQETKRPVANMGLGIYAGLRFMLDSVVPRLGEGDVVVLSPEYQFFYGLFEGDEELFEVLEAFPEGIRYIRSPRQAYMLARASLIFAKLKFKRVVLGALKAPAQDCVYCRAAFDGSGDLVAHLTLPSLDISAMSLFRKGRRATTIDETALERIESFARKAKQRGAQVVVIYPPLPERQFADNRQRIERVHERMSEIEGLIVLAPPAESVYPTENFFDWVYHLNATGRARRTEDVIRLVAPLL